MRIALKYNDPLTDVSSSRGGTTKRSLRKEIASPRKIVGIVMTVFFFFAPIRFFSQDDPVSIKVRKEQNLVKAYFDNVDLKLMAVDRFGNPRENKMLSYKFWIKGEKGSIEGYSNSLNPEMTSELKKLKKATKIFFTEIKVEDDQGHPVKLPDLYEVWFPNCTNCDGVGKKRR